ncbi:Uncharacterized protein GBIM_02454 [Gryllus bimaculatus]|nr:Uncharacterized protein GBIM_02454 [Gryllus bimaculatus]
MFYHRMKMYKPGQEQFASYEPDHYKVEDMFVGNRLHLNEHEFLLVDADEYALRYLECHGAEFPKNDVNQTLDKLRTHMFKDPHYKEVLRKYMEKKEECKEDTKGIVSYCDMRKILKETFGEEITEQELITIARKYNACCRKSKIDKETLRSIVHTELKRFLFADLERLLEGFCELDRGRTGFVPRPRAYALCRAARLPVDKALLLALLDAMPENENHEISYPDLVQFLDYKKHPCFHSIPINQKITFGIDDKSPEPAVSFVDLQLLLKDLNVEIAVKNECT